MTQPMEINTLKTQIVAIDGLQLSIIQELESVEAELLVLRNAVQSLIKWRTELNEQINTIITEVNKLSNTPGKSSAAVQEQLTSRTK